MSNWVIAGIDESNKGQVFGPIFVAIAYTTSMENELPRINDSKKVSTKQISDLDMLLKKYNVSYQIEEIPLQELEFVNINLLIKEKMKKLILKINPNQVYVDSHYPNVTKLKNELVVNKTTQVEVMHRADEVKSIVAFASLVAYRRKLQYFKEKSWLVSHGRKGICFIGRKHARETVA